MMKSNSRSNGRPLSSCALVHPHLPVKAPVHPFRAMHEIKRRIFKQLVQRIDKEKPFAA